MRQFSTIAIIDTNVVVAGLVTPLTSASTRSILLAMAEGRFPFALSPALLREYRAVAQRPRIRSRHRLADQPLDDLLVEITTNAMVVDPPPSLPLAPDRADQHLWDLLAALPRSVLVTGDARLLDRPSGYRLLTPSQFVGQFPW